MKRKGLSFVLSLVLVVTSALTVFAQPVSAAETTEIALPSSKSITATTRFSSETPIGNVAELQRVQGSSSTPIRRTRANEFYQAIQGYVTDPNQWAYVVFNLYDGEYLQVQMDLPNTSALDYDLILAIADDQGNLYQLDSSRNRTYINGSNGTLPESAGWRNTLGGPVNVYILAESYVGSSSSLPFTFHIGATMNYDAYEPDSIHNSLVLSLPPAGNTGTITSRSLLTLADNDWYRFTVPSGIDEIDVSLDNTSIQSGYRVEMYELYNSQAYRVDISGGTAYVSSGTYYVRVTSNHTSLNSANYRLYITPKVPPQILGRLNVSKTISPYGEVGSVSLGSLSWETDGYLIVELDYPTPSNTYLSVKLGQYIYEFNISNGKYFHIPLNYLQTSYTATLSIANDSYNSFYMSGTITSWA